MGGLKPVADNFEKASKRMIDTISDPDSTKDASEGISDVMGGVADQLVDSFEVIGKHTDVIADTLFNEDAWKNTGDDLVDSIQNIFSNLLPSSNFQVSNDQENQGEVLEFPNDLTVDDLVNW